jgi:hypothetical protein
VTLLRILHQLTAGRTDSSKPLLISSFLVAAKLVSLSGELLWGSQTFRLTGRLLLAWLHGLFGSNSMQASWSFVAWTPWWLFPNLPRCGSRADRKTITPQNLKPSKWMHYVVYRFKYRLNVARNLIDIKNSLTVNTLCATAIADVTSSSVK